MIIVNITLNISLCVYLIKGIVSAFFKTVLVSSRFFLIACRFLKPSIGLTLFNKYLYCQNFVLTRV